MTKLCLNMIVKNEVANLERCLRSAVGQIACWVIVDTGSTDGTQDLIRRFFESHDVPGELHSAPFENFSQARNTALDLARDSTLSFDYLLFADADMELTVADSEFVRSLTADAYQVRQTSSEIAYWNLRLLRRDSDARYVGVTHEYLALSAGETRQLETVGYVDHASGANRPGKSARDSALLSKALETETDAGLRARYTFYLASSLRDDGDRAGALERYLERSRLGHWQEEVFVSLLNAAELRIALGDSPEKALATFEEATAACPTRAEALHGAARLCRDRQLYERGYQFAARGVAISMPRAGLFVTEWIYAFGLHDELSICAYWTGRYAESLIACDRLLAEPRLPRDEYARVLRNQQFAADRLRERRQKTRSAMPRIFHFITGLDSNFGGKSFSFIHAMAILSALRVNEGFVARVYYENEPDGPYWALIKPHVVCIRIVAPREFSGHRIEHFAHAAHVVRLQVLLEHGGVYLDLDTICQKPFAPLLEGAVVMGLEKTSDGATVGLCNATIIAPPGAEFLRLWLESYDDFTIWNRFSVQLPMQLAEEHPGLVRIESNTSFFWPSWDDAGIAALFLEDRAYPEAYSLHLWESKSWEHLRRLDASRVQTIDTTYNRVARRFAKELELSAAAAPGPSMKDATHTRSALAGAFSKIYERYAWSHASGLGATPIKYIKTHNDYTWSGQQDSNLRPEVPKTSALPGCAIPRPTRAERVT